MKHIRGKFVGLLGLAAGYVLGSRAGRAPYEKIKRTTSRVRKNPRVEEAVQVVEDTVKARAQEAGEALKHVTKATAESMSRKVTLDKDSTDTQPRNYAAS